MPPDNEHGDGGYKFDADGNQWDDFNGCWFDADGNELNEDGTLAGVYTTEPIRRVGDPTE